MEATLRPSIIPVGFDIHVTSPPSNPTQYLDVRVQFRAVLEYELFEGLKIGVDGRDH